MTGLDLSDCDWTFETLKSKLLRYKELVESKQRTEAEIEEMLDLRMFFRHRVGMFNVELRFAWQEIEDKREGK